MKNTEVKLRYLPFPYNEWVETFLSGGYLGQVAGVLLIGGKDW
jgi:hypothetical protein